LARAGCGAAFDRYNELANGRSLQGTETCRLPEINLDAIRNAPPCRAAAR